MKLIFFGDILWRQTDGTIRTFYCILGYLSWKREKFFLELIVGGGTILNFLGKFHTQEAILAYILLPIRDGFEISIIWCTVFWRF